MKELVDIICTQMSHRFHKIELHVLLLEAAALDPRFKKKSFLQDEHADRAYQRLCNAAARVTLPNQQAEGEEEGAQEGSSTQESAIWRDFDEQVSGLVTSRNTTADSVLKVRAFLEEPLVLKSSNPLMWWQSQGVVYPRLSEVMKKRLCIVATSVHHWPPGLSSFSPSSALYELYPIAIAALLWWHEWSQKSKSIRATHIPGYKNSIADSLSFLFSEMQILGT